MAYLGNSFNQQIYTPATDFFSGDGIITTFTLTRPLQSVYGIEVVVNNVQQNPSNTYTINTSGQIVFVEAPSIGVNNIYVSYNAPIAQFNGVGQGTVGSQQIALGSMNATILDSGNLNGTGGLTLPAGTTGQRPVNPTLGMHRWNTTLNTAEVYIGSGNWQAIASTGYSVDYLIVAGGGAGGSSSVNSSCGGGGAGGFIAGTAVAVNPGASYPAIVGAGGTGVLNSQGGSGQNSSLFSYTAIGGGGGGGGTSSTSTSPGAPGGSGGGSLQPSAPGAGTAGQGNIGGTGNASSPSWGGGGGGGAGGAGTAGTPTNAGPGGPGSLWSNGFYYAGGGGGATYNGHIGGAGGSGGGGAGGSTGFGTPGSPNTGGGGGAASYPGSSYGAGANGGSGVVIIRYSGQVQRGTGGTVSFNNGYVYHTFTSSGTFVA